MTAETDREPIESPGDLIREIVRTYYGGRDTDLAKAVGVNRATVGRWISEERAISAIELFRVVAVITSGHQEREAPVSRWLNELAGFDGLRVEAVEPDTTPRVWEREQADDMGVRARMARAVVDGDPAAFMAAEEEGDIEWGQLKSAGRQRLGIDTSSEGTAPRLVGGPR